MPYLAPQTGHPPADDVEDLDELVDELRALLGGPLSTSAFETTPDDEVFLPRSWLSRTLLRVRIRQGDTEHVTTTRRSRQQLLVAILNRLDADVERVLSVHEPRVEVETVYEGVRRLEESAEAETGESEGS